MRKRTIRLWSVLLAFIMVINLLPMPVLAEDVEQPTPSNSSNASERSLNTAEAQIIEEVLESRTEYGKEFILSNGLHMAAVYMEPVHYLENGQWEEIDNTLRLSGEGQNAVYTNTAGDWEISFPQQLSENHAVSVAKNGYTLSFVLAGEIRKNPGLATASEDAASNAELHQIQEANTASARIQEVPLAELRENAEYPEILPEKTYSRLGYNGVYDNTNIIYDLTGGQLKESIVIGSYEDSLIGYRYHLEVGDMVPVLSENGEIRLYTAYFTDEAAFLALIQQYTTSSKFPG